MTGSEVPSVSGRGALPACPRPQRRGSALGAQLAEAPSGHSGGGGLGGGTARGSCAGLASVWVNGGHVAEEFRYALS